MKEIAKNTFIFLGSSSNSINANTGTHWELRELNTNIDDETLDPVLVDLHQKQEKKKISVGSRWDGNQPFRFKSDQVFIPASITKIITSALTLEVFKPDETLPLEITWTENPNTEKNTATNLTLYSNGDPTWGHSDFEKDPYSRFDEIVETLKEHQITTIRGEIHLDSFDNRMDEVHPTPGFLDEDYEACYGSQAQSFNFKKNCSSLFIIKANEAQWNDSRIAFPFIFDFIVGSYRRPTLLPIPLNSDQPFAAYRFSGNWPDGGKKEYWFERPVYNSKDWFRSILKSRLDKADIQALPITSENDFGRTPNLQTNRKNIDSPTIENILTVQNKNSDNFLADSFFDRLGNSWNDDTLSIEEGARAYVSDRMQSWAMKFQNPEYFEELKFVEGSGISRENQVSARSFLSALTYIQQQTYFETLLNTLPVMGKDGTLKNRQRDGPARGVVHAKTGSLKDMYQLAGYLIEKNPDEKIIRALPFVILTSTSKDRRFQARAFQDQVCAILAKKFLGTKEEGL